MIYWNELIMANPMPKNYLYAKKFSPRLRNKRKQHSNLVKFCETSSIKGFRFFLTDNFHNIERVFLYMSFLALVILLMEYVFIVEKLYATEATTSRISPNYNASNKYLNWPSVVFDITEPVNELDFPSVFKRYDIPDTNQTREYFKFLSKANFRNLDKLPQYQVTKSHLWKKILTELAYMNIVNFVDPEWPVEVVFSELGLYFTRIKHNDSGTVIIPDRIVYPLDFLPLKKSGVIKNVAAYEKMTTPQMTELVVVPPASTIIMIVDLLETVATPEVRRLRIEQRSCMYHDERTLKYWPYYYQKLCMIECRMNTSMKLCGCIAFFVAQPEFGDNVCTTIGMNCIVRNKLHIIQRKPSACRCLPDCEKLNYRVTRFSNKTIEDPFRFGNGLSIYVGKSRHSYAYKREVSFGFIEYLVSIGGICSIFLGASVMSIAEFVYFFILLPIINWSKLVKTVMKQQCIGNEIKNMK